MRYVIRNTQYASRFTFHVSRSTAMISFTPTDEQQLIIETVRRYATERLRPAAHDADENRAVPPEIITKGWDLGLLPSAIPEQYGGFGDSHSAVAGALAAEELAYGDLAMALYL